MQHVTRFSLRSGKSRQLETLRRKTQREQKHLLTVGLVLHPASHLPLVCLLMAPLSPFQFAQVLDGPYFVWNNLHPYLLLSEMLWLKQGCLKTGAKL